MWSSPICSVPGWPQTSSSPIAFPTSCAACLPKGVQPGLRPVMTEYKKTVTSRRCSRLLAGGGGHPRRYRHRSDPARVLGSAVLTALWLGLVLGLAARWRTGGGEVRAGQPDAPRSPSPISGSSPLPPWRGHPQYLRRFAVSVVHAGVSQRHHDRAAWWIAPLLDRPEIRWPSVSSSAAWCSFVPVPLPAPAQHAGLAQVGLAPSRVVKIRTLMIPPCSVSRSARSTC